MRTSIVVAALFLSVASAAAPVRADGGDPYALRIVLDTHAVSRSVPDDRSATVTSRFGACDVAIIRKNGTLYHVFPASEDMRGFALEPGDELKFARGQGSCAISLTVYAKPDPAGRFPDGRF